MSSYHYSPASTMSFPPGTITSKLSSKKLKKPPSPKDWMHQTYLQMIQDVSYVTSHYYESPENGNHLLLGNKVHPDKHETHCPKKSAAIVDTTLSHTSVDDTPPIPPPKDCYPSSSPLALYKVKGKDKEDQIYESEEEDNEYDEDDEDDDSQSEQFNTFTTSSTDCNRKNNIYRFYREQQSLQADPITEESSVIRVATPYSSSSSCIISSNSYGGNAYYISNSSSSEVSQDGENHDDGTSTVTQQQRGHKTSKKKFKLLKNMMTKMKMAAEKPFWAIDSHF